MEGSRRNKRRRQPEHVRANAAAWHCRAEQPSRGTEALGNNSKSGISPPGNQLLPPAPAAGHSRGEPSPASPGPSSAAPRAASPGAQAALGRTDRSVLQKWLLRRLAASAPNRSAQLSRSQPASLLPFHKCTYARSPVFHKAHTPPSARRPSAPPERWRYLFTPLGRTSPRPAAWDGSSSPFPSDLLRAAFADSLPIFPQQRAISRQTKRLHGAVHNSQPSDPRRSPSLHFARKRASRFPQKANNLRTADSKTCLRVQSAHCSSALCFMSAMCQPAL